MELRSDRDGCRLMAGHTALRPIRVPEELVAHTGSGGTGGLTGWSRGGNWGADRCSWAKKVYVKLAKSGPFDVIFCKSVDVLYMFVGVFWPIRRTLSTDFRDFTDYVSISLAIPILGGVVDQSSSLSTSISGSEPLSSTEET